MRKLGTLICLLLISVSVGAQSKSTKKATLWQPWGVAEVGFVAGSYEPGGDLRLQGGFAKNNLKLGVGMAKDEYRFGSAPIYLQVRRSFFSGKRRPFLLASAGYNFATEPDRINDWIGIWWPGTPTVYQYSSGYYGELGAGYTFRATQKWGYTISFSYTRKTMSEEYNSTIWNGINTENTVTKNVYRMNRYAIRIGFRLGK